MFEKNLRISAIWCLGEYGELLSSAKVARQASEFGDEDQFEVTNPLILVKTFRRNSDDARNSVGVKHYAVTACVKLTQRFPQQKE